MAEIDTLTPKQTRPAPDGVPQYVIDYGKGTA
jgi:hypothetical protein